MQRSLKIHLLAQLIAWTIACCSAGFVGLTSFGALGGVAMGVAPEFTFGIVERAICPEGAQMEFNSIHRSYHQPGEREPHLECVAADGARLDVLLPGILSVLVLSFLVTSGPILLGVGLPLTAIAYLAARAMAKRGAEPAGSTRQPWR
jgi:hypothetical protein